MGLLQGVYNRFMEEQSGPIRGKEEAKVSDFLGWDYDVPYFEREFFKGLNKKGCRLREIDVPS